MTSLSDSGDPAALTKYFTTTTGTSYAYDYVPATGGRSTLLLLHGFPSTRADWHRQFQTLSRAGYGVLAPDMLGFGASDRPTDVNAFRTKPLTDDIIALLDAENLKTVVGVAHDYGSDFLSRLYFYHQDRLEKLAFLSVGYAPVGFRLDVDAINAASLADLGYTQFGYWYFMNSYDAGPVITENLESFYSTIYTSDAASWIPNFAHIGGLRNRLTSGISTEPLAGWDSQAHKDNWMRLFSRPGAIESAVGIYRRLMRGVNAVDEAGVNPMNATIHVPVLVIGGSQDKVTFAEAAVNNTRTFARDKFRGVVLDGGHWLQMEKADEVSSELLDFVNTA
ncbi:Alpha/Beta hydrolase protein [Microdochium trichocladiopsis]|uniref:Alpha/Beta hydrolase protein n=1 Tax=Microdochium trichocladiopsis TaxID=1682393 RepID=A0A9P8XYY6_9PEZI|nr:Alpha/Beta hydrolase protein [Microdochium trichocladiopsis]KAH7024645.1 Alpha/Beta hydrolase protein [Microdochium trichocladiopsis]